METTSEKKQVIEILGTLLEGYLRKWIPGGKMCWFGWWTTVD